MAIPQRAIPQRLAERQPESLPPVCRMKVQRVVPPTWPASSMRGRSCPCTSAHQSWHWSIRSASWPARSATQHESPPRTGPDQASPSAPRPARRLRLAQQHRCCACHEPLRQGTIHPLQHPRRVSDLLGILPGGRFLAVELKSRGGKVTQAQRSFLDHVTAAGGVALVISDLAELDRELARLTGDGVGVCTQLRD